MMARTASCEPMVALSISLPFELKTRAPAFRQRSASKNIRRDDDSVRIGAVGNPIIGRIEAVRHHLKINAGLSRRADMAIGHNRDRDFMATPDFIGFVPHGAGVSVDIDVHTHAPALICVPIGDNSFIQARFPIIHE